MAIPKDLLSLYRGLSIKEAFYVRARLAISPIEYIEHALPSIGNIYDIGCGVGLLSNVIALGSEKRRVVGIDLSSEKIGIARRSVGSRDNIKFEIGDALTMAIDHPDAVTACDLLHHIKADMQERLLRRIYQLLGAGGMLLIQDIDTRPLCKYLFARSVDMVLNNAEPVYYRRCGEWVSLLKAIGFKVDIVNLHKGYPIAAILFNCVKN